jgi:probable F420-dependent oxidoreductase
MPTHHPYRFGLQVAQAGSAREWKELALRTEADGFSTLLLPDFDGPMLSPLPALAAAATATTTLRVGTWVLANDFRNPVLLAREAATLDLLSDGRFELGLGAGRADNGLYRSLGMHADSGGVRVGRLGDSVRIINRLFRGESVNANGDHYSITDASLYPPPLRPIPMLIAAGGRRATELAAAEADIVALWGMSAEELITQLDWLAAAAGERLNRIERSARLFVLPENAVDRQSPGGLDFDALIASGSPHVVTGSTDAIIERFEEGRERFGISYYVTDEGSRDALTPVIARLSGR